MDRGMASSLPVEKLDRSNYASWSYKMHQYLLGRGYWSFVKGANEMAPNAAHKDFPVWEQSASKVMYLFASSARDQLLSHIRGAKTPKEPWGNVKKVFACKHHNPKAATPTERHVSGRLHGPDQREL